MNSNNIYDLVRRRETQSDTTQGFQRQLHAHPPLIERLGLEKELEGHSGCVNCLEWNEDGTILLSGSDDFNTILWDPLRHKMKCVLSTGHIGNIFSVKFLPNTGDRIIATAAADTKVRIHSVDKMETTQVYNCHIGRVKRLATAPNTPFIIWSASEDGTIRQFDLRQPHNCSSCSKYCQNVLINLNIHIGSMAEAKCLNINPRQPELLAVGCNDPFARLYDHRMLAMHSFQEGSSHCSTNTCNPEDSKLPVGCVKYFSPGHLPHRFSKDFHRRSKSYVSTYVTFSPNGRELLVNLGGEQIYLFDICGQNRSLRFDIHSSKYGSPCKGTNGVVKGVVDGVSGVFDHTLQEGCSSQNGMTNGYKVVPCIKEDKRSQYYATKANNLKLRGNDAFCQQNWSKAISLYNQAIMVSTSAVLYANRAAALLKRNWDGDVYSALRDCITALHQDSNHTKAHFRQARCLYELGWFQEALECLNRFKAKFPDQAEGNSIRQLERDIKAATFSDTSGNDMEDCGNGTVEGASRSQRKFTIAVNQEEKELRESAIDFTHRYCGHCNTTTDIKEASFFGGEGQYIVAGSDDGSFFMWERDSANICRVLNGDSSIVNCLQPHPSMCLIASSGIDSVVRLWSPKPQDGTVETRVVSEVNNAARANQKRMNADPLEVMLMNMGFRRSPSGTDNVSDDDESDEIPVSCRTS